MMTEYINYTVFTLMAALAIWSILVTIKLNKHKDLKKINAIAYKALPSIFVTLGVLGTFAGIYIGLQDFKVAEADIQNSIEGLLEGLKTSFLTSLVGIVLSIIFGRIHDYFYSLAQSETVYETSELSALNEINNTVKSLKTVLSNQGDSTITAIKELKKEGNEIRNSQLAIVKSVSDGMSGQHVELLGAIEGLTSSITPEKTLKSWHTEALKSTETHNTAVLEEFKKFGKILAENNAQALVDVMQSATDSFNEQMNAIVERLVKENFQELNASVSNMVQWQSDNKEFIEVLTAEFKKVQENFSISSEQVAKITESTNSLVEDEGKLVTLITQLKEVLVDNNKFEEITNNLGTTAEQLTSTTGKLDKSVVSYDEATEKLKQWIGAEKSFKDQISILLTKLEEYQKIKEYNEDFWAQTKESMEEGVGIIKDASVHLKEDIQSINKMFLNELNDLLNSLDELIVQKLQ